MVPVAENCVAVRGFCPRGGNRIAAPLCQNGPPVTHLFLTMQPRKPEISDQTVAEALRLARANQVPGQTKEQTQLIAQGIQKGITEYKRSQKAKQREADRLRKKQKRASSASLEAEDAEESELELAESTTPVRLHWLSWCLLLLTWAGIVCGYFFGR